MEKMARYLRNISYFCIVKQKYQHISIDLRNFIALLALPVLMFLFPAKATAAQEPFAVCPDSLHVYLLTCSPHQEVYSLYGHTAIRLENRQTGGDYAINYGVFSFDKPFFVARFVFGLTDYEMGIYPTNLFREEYRHYGSGVTEQEINMTPEEKLRFFKAVDENYQPENRVYRYNFFYDNCTTRARDIIVNSIDGKVVYDVPTPKDGTTFREMIHQMNADHPWARLGNDLLLGIGADRQLDIEQTQFLPHVMFACAEKAYIVDNKGVKRPFVAKQDEMIEEGVQVVESEFPLTPLQCVVLLVAAAILVSAIEWKRKKYIWWFDAIVLLGHGIAGIALTLMIFSQHPTVSLNTQLLMFNILPLLFGVQAIRKYQKGVVHWLWLVMIILVCLMLVLYSFNVQWLDISVRLLALCLLLRCGMKMLRL